MTTITENIVDPDAPCFTPLLEARPLEQKAYWYKVKHANTQFNATVIAINSTTARKGIEGQFANAAISFISESTIILQVNA